MSAYHRGGVFYFGPAAGGDAELIGCGSEVIEAGTLGTCWDLADDPGLTEFQSANSPTVAETSDAIWGQQSLLFQIFDYELDELMGLGDAPEICDLLDAFVARNPVNQVTPISGPPPVITQATVDALSAQHGVTCP